MRSNQPFAFLACLAVLGFLASDASAYYHPTVGRFVQRDPGPGGAMTPARAGGTGQAVAGQYLQRDGGPWGPGAANRAFGAPKTPLLPQGQYADGMNLYPYAAGSPAGYVDPDGTSAVDCKVRVHRLDVSRKNAEGEKDLNVGHTWIEYGDKSIGFWPAGDLNWGPGAVHTPDLDADSRPDRTWTTTKSDSIHRKMGAGKYTYLPCLCANCSDVYDCIKSVGRKWDKSTFSLLFRNCRSFVHETLGKCCLDGGPQD